MISFTPIFGYFYGYDYENQAKKATADGKKWNQNIYNE